MIKNVNKYRDEFIGNRTPVFLRNKEIKDEIIDSDEMIPRNGNKLNPPVRKASFKLGKQTGKCNTLNLPSPRDPFQKDPSKTKLSIRNKSVMNTR